MKARRRTPPFWGAPAAGDADEAGAEADGLGAADEAGAEVDGLGAADVVAGAAEVAGAADVAGALAVADGEGWELQLTINRLQSNRMASGISNFFNLLLHLNFFPES